MSAEDNVEIEFPSLQTPGSDAPDEPDPEESGLAWLSSLFGDDEDEETDGVHGDHDDDPSSSERDQQSPPEGVEQAAELANNDSLDPDDVGDAARGEAELPTPVGDEATIGSLRPSALEVLDSDTASSEDIAPVISAALLGALADENITERDVTEEAIASEYHVEENVIEADEVDPPALPSQLSRPPSLTLVPAEPPDLLENDDELIPAPSRRDEKPSPSRAGFREAILSTFSQLHD